MQLCAAVLGGVPTTAGSYVHARAARAPGHAASRHSTRAAAGEFGGSGPGPSDAAARAEALINEAVRDAQAKTEAAQAAASAGVSRALRLSSAVTAFWGAGANADVASGQALSTHREALLEDAPPGAYTRAVAGLSNREVEQVLMHGAVEEFRNKARQGIEKLANASAAAAADHVAATERAAAANKKSRLELMTRLRAAAETDVVQVLGALALRDSEFGPAKSGTQGTTSLEDAAAQAVARAAAHAVASLNAQQAGGGSASAEAQALLPTVLAGEFLADAAARTAGTDALVAAFQSKMRETPVVEATQQ